MSKKGIVGICNPTLDSFAFVDDSFLTENNFVKNSNIFPPLEVIQKVKSKVKFEVEACGDSPMNALRWVGLLGYRTAAFGQYGDDEWGKILTKGIGECNVENKCIIKKGSITTNFCIFITPDAARTMMAVYGASREDYAEQVDWNFIDDYECVLVGGYHFADDFSMKTVDAVLSKAIELNKKIVVMLCGAFSVPGFKENILKYYNKINIISGNHEEWMALLDKTSVDDVYAHLEKSHFDIAAVTLAENGSCIIKDGKKYWFEAPKLEKLIDTTGAGDSYVAGMLYGHFSGMSVEDTGKLASHLTGLTISRVGCVSYTNADKDLWKDFVTK